MQKSLGQINYETLMEAMWEHSKTWSDSHPWEKLDANAKMAWEKAARRVRQQVEEKIMAEKPIGKAAKKLLKEEMMSASSVETVFRCVACWAIVTESEACIPPGTVPRCKRDNCPMWPIK